MALIFVPISGSLAHLLKGFNCTKFPLGSPSLFLLLSKSNSSNGMASFKRELCEHQQTTHVVSLRANSFGLSFHKHRQKEGYPRKKEKNGGVMLSTGH
jgi:hypothetical protein